MVGHSSVAAALAVLPADDAPRVIRQFTSTFFVSRLGELWRVYDVDDPSEGERHAPSAESTHPHRVFIALARKAQTCVYTFGADNSRDIDPNTLQAQLDASEAR